MKCLILFPEMVWCGERERERRDGLTWDVEAKDSPLAYYYSYGTMQDSEDVWGFLSLNLNSHMSCR